MANITFITAFKKFKGLYDNIQKSAIYSCLMNDIQIIAPNNEVGLRESSKAFPIKFIEGVQRGRDLGFTNQCPVIKDLIIKALPLVETEMVAFINSDIIIYPDFSETLDRIIEKYGYDIFMVGVRRELNLKRVIDSPQNYKEVLLERWMKGNDQNTSSDIFISSKFIFRRIGIDMPEFLLGRFAWDNWMHYFGQRYVSKHYNCTESLPIIHCVHGFDHIKNQEGEIGKNAPSSMHNIGLWKPYEQEYGTPQIKNWSILDI